MDGWMDVYTDYGPNPSNKIRQTYCLSPAELLLIRFPTSQTQGWFAQLKRSAMSRLQSTKSRQLITALRFRTTEQAFGTFFLSFFIFFAHCFMTTADQLCDRHINQLENYKTFTQQWRGTFTTFNCVQTYRNLQVEWRSTRHRTWFISLSDPIKNNCKYWTPRSSVVSIGFLSLS